MNFKKITIKPSGVAVSINPDFAQDTAQKVTKEYNKAKTAELMLALEKLAAHASFIMWGMANPEYDFLSIDDWVKSRSKLISGCVIKSIEFKSGKAGEMVLIEFTKTADLGFRHKIKLGSVSLDTEVSNYAFVKDLIATTDEIKSQTHEYMVSDPQTSMFEDQDSGDNEAEDVKQGGNFPEDLDSVSAGSGDDDDLFE